MSQRLVPSVTFLNESTREAVQSGQTTVAWQVDYVLESRNKVTMSLTIV